MTKSQKVSLVILRISLGFLFFWSGFSKVIDPAWSAEGYLRSAKSGTDFFLWLTDPAILPFVNILNEWGQLLLGISLILGLGIRLSSILGIILMAFYYATLGFPYPNSHSLIVDEHIIYATVLLLLFSLKAGRIWGLGVWSYKISWLKNWFD
jgi:thiosulfate dehydrogenase [quinone] large subunit